MKISKFLVFAFLGAILLNSCSSDDDNAITDDGPDDPDQSQGTYDDGFFVLNEGGGGAPGSVTFVNDGLGEAQQHVYQEVNGGDIGNFAQSIFFDDQDRAYIISNGSNLITVVDRYSFEKIGTVDSGLEVPRYGVVANGKAYVTNQADFATNTDDFVAVINLENLTVENTVVIGDYGETIFKSEENKLYIQNAAYNEGNHVTVFNPNTDVVEGTIETADNLNSIALADNILYALSANKLEKINLDGDTNEGVSVDLTYDSTPQNLIIATDNTAYFTVDKEVFAMGLSDTTAPDSALMGYSSDSDFGAMYGFAVEDSKIYIADGGDFASDSFVEVYSLNGDLLQTIDVGIAPNGFYFN